MPLTRILSFFFSGGIQNWTTEWMEGSFGWMQSTPNRTPNFGCDPRWRGQDQKLADFWSSKR